MRHARTAFRRFPPALFACLLLLPGLPFAAGALAAEEAAPAAIAWNELGSPVLERARSESKPILLFIDAPWGHWDRLMAEVAFTDPGVVSLVNQRFVPVRASVLLRPDIDLRYGLGGWPTVTFLLPTGDPLYIKDPAGKVLRAGGNFFAPDDLSTYLSRMADYYGQNREAAEETAAEIAKNVLGRSEVAEAPLSADLVEVSVTKLIAAYGEWLPDPAIKEPRYPDLDSIELGLEYYKRTGNRNILDLVLRLMTDMARGGIRDHLGGGFHRFATDAAWRVPAFEKLLSVNAELLDAYNEAWLVTGNRRYRGIAEGIADYATGTLESPEGWFYAYQAADASLAGDGDYYTWTVEEVSSVLSGKELKLIIPSFDIEGWGELAQSAPRRNVLYLSEGPFLLSQRLKMDQEEVERTLESARRKMLEARSARPAPPVGRILVTAPAAAMGAALLRAAGTWERPELRQTALASIEQIWRRNFVKEKGLMDRAWSPGEGNTKTPDFFIDQVQMTRALIAAYESTGDGQYLERAWKLAETTDEAFADSLYGGWSDRVFSSEAPGLLSWPTRSIRENSYFAEALVRLHHLRGAGPEDKILASARKALESWADEFGKFEQSGSAFGLAVEHMLQSPLEVIVVGRESDKGYSEVRSASVALHHPWMVVAYASTDEARARLSGRGVDLPDGASTVLCLGERCSGALGRGTKLWASLRSFLGGPAEGPEETAVRKKEEAE